MKILLVRKMTDLHRSTGAFLGIFLFVIMLSGSWSLGSDALRLWWNKAPLSGEFLPLSQLLALQPNAALIQLPSATNPIITFCLGMGQCNESYSAISGQPLVQETPAMWLVTLHKNLFMGFPGRIFMSLFGFALAVLLISGFIMHRHKIAAMMRLPRRDNLRLFLHDLHSGLGLWCYPWLIIFAVTGALSGLGALGTVGLAQSVSPGNPQAVMQQLMAEFHPVTEQTNIQRYHTPQQVLAHLNQSYPDFIAQTLMIKDKSWVIGGVRVNQPSTSNFEQYQVEDGRFIGIRDSAQQDFWVRAFMGIQPLHYGQYQWLPHIDSFLSAMHFIAGFSGCVLVASGLAMWCWRRATSRISGLIVGCCGGLLLSVSTLLMLMSLPLTSSISFFFLFWGGSVLMSITINNARRVLILIATLSASLLLMACFFSLWLQPASFSRIDFTMLFSSLFLLLTLGCIWKLFPKQKGARSEYERSITK